MKLNTIFRVILIALVAFLFYQAGIWQGQEKAEKSLIVVVETLVPLEMYIDREVVREVIIEKEVLQDIRPFTNRQAFEEWFAANLVTKMGTDKCVAEALEMQRRAYRDGYQLSTEALFSGTDEPSRRTWHMVNSTVIGRAIFFADPVTGKVWEAAHAIKSTESRR